MSCNARRGLSSRVSSPKAMGGMLLLPSPAGHEPIYLKWGETGMFVVTFLHFSPPKHELNHSECSPSNYSRSPDSSGEVSMHQIPEAKQVVLVVK